MASPDDLAWTRRPAMRGDYARIFAQTLGMQARDVAPLVQGTALTPACLADPDIRISAEDQIRIYANGLRHARDPGLGLAFGQRLTLAAHGPVGFLMSSSATLGAALTAVVTYLPTRINFILLDGRESADALVVTASFRLPLAPEMAQFLGDTIAAAFYEIARQIVPGPLSGIVIDLPFARPAHAARYAAHAGVTYRFGAPHLRVCVPRVLCETPNTQADGAAYRIALDHCRKLLAEADAASTIAARVAHLMLAAPPGSLSAAQAAESLFMSPRTLARRLAEDGTSFRALREDTLSKQAAALLQDKRLSIDAVAAHLNFHDSSSFRRAFRRWFGCTPDQLRKKGQGTR